MDNEDQSKALELARCFIRLEREYRKTRRSEILKEMKRINEEYAKANGGGDLYMVTGSCE